MSDKIDNKLLSMALQSLTKELMIAYNSEDPAKIKLSLKLALTVIESIGKIFGGGFIKEALKDFFRVSELRKNDDKD